MEKKLEILRNFIKQKKNQGCNVKIRNNYNFLVLNELYNLEKLSIQCDNEFRLISKFIRTNILNKYKEDEVYRAIFILNNVSNWFSDYFGQDTYWTIDTVIDYAKLVINAFPGCSGDKTKLLDDIYISHASKYIKSQWDNILIAGDSKKSFLDVFDDIFTNAIGEYPDSFIKTLSDSDVLCRMVKEKECDENRFIPYAKSTNQNRWNPPGKAYLYMSYGDSEHFYNSDLCLEEMVCVLECRTKSGTDVSFCRFEPKVGGKILDLSYNDVELSDSSHQFNEFVNDYTYEIILKLLNEEDIISKKYYNKNKVDNLIKTKIEESSNTKKTITEITTKQILKIICNSIYTKVDGTEEEKEKKYKSFHILSQYLESKGITGIIYPCTRNSTLKGKNIVLFKVEDAYPIPGTIKRYYYV